MKNILLIILLGLFLYGCGGSATSNVTVTGGGATTGTSGPSGSNTGNPTTEVK
jgi:hypothetical protein